VAAERARSALSAPVAPHLGSTRDGQNVLLDVPFRSALDGSDYADTNSGTAAVAMALEAYGFNVPTADLRALANTLTRTYDVSQPPRIDTLVRVGEQVGLRGLGLFQGVRFTVWSVDNVKDRVRAGYPVLTQIRLDGPPADGELGRERFVLIVGIQDENLVYHDPAYPGQQGAARTMPASGLLKAWVNSPGSSQAAAFALSPTELGLFATRDQLVAAQVQPEKQPTPETRDVPTPGPGQLLGPLAQLIPVSPTDSVPAAAAAAAADSGLPFHPPQLHPMLFLFCVVGGVVLLKVVASLIFD
jgi:hypothetical protein